MLLLFFKRCFRFLFVFLSCRICQTHIVNDDSKIVVKYSSESFNLSVLNSNKVAFVTHESQKVASKSFMIRNFIYHF